MPPTWILIRHHTRICIRKVWRIVSQLLLMRCCWKLVQKIMYKQQHSANSDVDPRDEQITALTRDLEDERFEKERLIAEARSRIEQYENRLAQMHSECEYTKREVDEAREECDTLRRDLASRDALREESDDVRVQEADERARLADERFGKMKAAYEKFRSRACGGAY
ncbi:ILWEQ [Parelaphostrongylus tenuis]|uniref:ILWEQ n=1 Tax=Parelaphostrongylus tenuis TaxID=148309 RepID=A0AAD5R7Y4_PARTN|nr:ILWEQ [Parelaphostrongylus tenuis]